MTTSHLLAEYLVPPKAGFQVALVAMMSVFFVQTAYGQEQDVVELSATVTGNQEQPKVLYIVPWKAADDDAILYQPLNSQTDNIFGHVERSEHKRQLKFIKDMEDENTSE